MFCIIHITFDFCRDPVGLLPLGNMYNYNTSGLDQKLNVSQNTKFTLFSRQEYMHWVGGWRERGGSLLKLNMMNINYQIYTITHNTLDMFSTVYSQMKMYI